MEIVGYILTYLGIGGLCLYWIHTSEGTIWNPFYSSAVNVLTILTVILLWPWIAGIELFLYLPYRKGWISLRTGQEEWIVLLALLDLGSIVGYVFTGYLAFAAGVAITSLAMVILTNWIVHRRMHEFKSRASCC